MVDQKKRRGWLARRAYLIKAIQNNDTKTVALLKAADWSAVAYASGGYKDISPLLLMKMAGQMGNHPTMSLMVASAAKIRAELYGWITSYTEREVEPGMGYLVFRQHWKLIRSWIPLQLRLAAEQIFYELGKPYTELITGFKPIN